MPSRLSHILVSVLLLVVVGCGGSDGTNVQAVASVSVSPETTTLTSLGATQQLSASARDASGSAVAGSDVTFTWTTSDAAVATVSSAGLAEAVSDGTATITATVGGGTTSGTATITVAQEAATISVTLAADTLTTGATTQADAEATDAGGSPLASPSVSWSSSDESVATVDAAGVVTGVSDGEATISASQDGASGMAALVVVRPDLTLSADTMLGGSVVVNELTIPAGTTVTLTSDVTIDAKVAVSIAGTVTGDCVGLTIGGEGTVEVSGTLDNACVTQALAGPDAPPLTIDAPAGADLTDATLVSSGPIEVTSESALATAGWSAAAGPSRAPALGTVDLTGATLKAEPAEVPQPTDPSATPHGADITLAGSLDVIVNGTRIQAQHGGPGVPVSQTADTPLEVRGGEGGSGGDVILHIAEGGTLRFTTTRGGSELSGGDGGPGGPANATTTQNASLDWAPAAAAMGGLGGEGGGVSISGHAVLTGGSDLSLVRVQVGHGGRGGNATAIGADGVDATATRDAQVGGDADANAGTGGAAGIVEGGYEEMAAPDGKQGGGGGVANANAGKGGDGIRARPNGAGGGNGSAFGGRSGNSTEEGGRTGGDAIVVGGNGGKGADVCPAFTDSDLAGQIAVSSDPASSDPFIFNAGSGIDLSVVFRVLDQVGGPGGDGGLGGDLAADGGTGGMGRSVRAPDGGASMGIGGNGGDGGAGVPGGAGGDSGGVGLLGNVDATRLDPIFTKGVNGGSCASLAPGPLLAEGDQTIEITGAAPWVDVTGTLAADGTVTASGRGTVAGFSNILTEFSGTWDAETGTLMGTYTIDSEKVISSGHPVIYDVTVSGG